MSLQFEFQLAFNFVEPLPSEVVETLEFLTGVTTELPVKWPDPEDDFIRSPDAKLPLLAMLAEHEVNCGESACSFRRVLRGTSGFMEEQSRQEHWQYTLHFRCLWLDDDFVHTWWKVVPWLAKYSDADGFVGYYCERDKTHPTLIYFRRGKVFIRESIESPVSLIDGAQW